MGRANPPISREVMRELDRQTIEQWGIPGRLLMENAGRAVAATVEEILGSAQNSTVAIICGPGNNGGDGFVVARTLLNRGVGVETFVVGSRDSYANQTDARVNLDLLLRYGHQPTYITKANESSAISRTLPSCSAVVDAIFGTGLTRSVEGVHSAAIEAINACSAPCVAVDIPSGLDANTGDVLGVAIKADVTVTFAVAKRGMYLAAGPHQCGRIEVVEVGIPRSLIENALKD